MKIVLNRSTSFNNFKGILSCFFNTGNTEIKEIVISDIFAAYCRKQLGIIK